jgi:hypothetical protein
MSTAVISVASYGLVLGGTLAAVTTSSVIPAALVAAAKVLRDLEPPPAGTTTPPDIGIEQARKAAEDLFALIPSGAGPVMKNALKSVDSLTLLVPKTAQVEAEFTLEGREQFKGGVSVGAQLQAVTVSAGYSALFEQKSGFRVKMTIDFATVDFPLDSRPA